jgi:hypothetical protein
LHTPRCHSRGHIGEAQSLNLTLTLILKGGSMVGTRADCRMEIALSLQTGIRASAPPSTHIHTCMPTMRTGTRARTYRVTDTNLHRQTHIYTHMNRDTRYRLRRKIILRRGYATWPQQSAVSAKAKPIER